MAKSDNPVIEIYKGIKIRKWNLVRLATNDSLYKDLIDIAEETGFSFKTILAISGQPCERCHGVDVVVYDDQARPHSIKRGILKSAHQCSGRTITQRNNAKNNSTCAAHNQES